MPKNPGKIIKSNLFWGLMLWVFGYVLGIIFFAFVPKNMIGWAILPFGVTVTLWVLMKKIKRESFGCYFGVSIFWTLIAVGLDYLFIVRVFHATDYYKPDVYVIIY